MRKKIQDTAGEAVRPEGRHDPRWPVRSRKPVALCALAMLLASCGGVETEGPAATAATSTSTNAGLTATRAKSAAESQTWLQVPQLADPLLDGLTPAPDAHLKGMWSPLVDWPINAIHMIVLPSGKVLTYGTRPSDNDGGTGNQDAGSNVLWDPAAGTASGAFTVTRFATDSKSQLNSFCSSATLMANGNVLSTGGFGGPYVENDARPGSSSFFSGEYSAATNMTRDTGMRTADERWYSTMLTLPDGRPIVLGGMLPYAENSWSNPSTTNGLASMTPEVFTPGTGWSLLPGAYSTDAFGQYLTRSEFPHAWVAPNGEIFGLSSDKMWFLDPKANGGQGAIRMAGDFKGAARALRAGETAATLPNVGSSTSTAVMFAPGKALQVGGNGYWVQHDLPASSAASVLDFNGAKVTVTETAPMASARRFFNSTVLPDGRVFVNAGTRANQDLGQAVYAPEIWSPATGAWSTMAPAQKARMYHNTAGLLPNGTVLTAGGGNPSAVFNRNAEVFYPPYLFKQANGVTRLAPRPVITGVSAFKARHGDPLSLLLGSSGRIADVVLMGLTVTTHGFNTGQRRIPVPFSQADGTLSFTAPDANLTPPGYYMALVVDADGVPSKGVIVAIGENVAEPPVPRMPLAPVALTGTLLTPAVAAGGAASYEPRISIASAAVSWDFGDGTPPTEFGANAAVAHTYAEPGVYTVVLRMRGMDGLISTYSFLQAVTPPATTTAKSAFSGSMAVDRAGAQLWVVNPDHNYVARIATKGGTRLIYPVGQQPAAVALSTLGFAAVSNKDAATLSILNANAMTLARNVALPRGSRPHGLVFSPDGATGYVALEGTGDVARFNVSTGALLPSIAVGGAIRHLAISGDGKRLAVSRYITPPVAGESTGSVDTGSGGGEIAIVDLANNTVARTVVLAQSRTADTAISGRGLPNYLGPLVMSPDERTALVPSKQDNIARGALRDGQALTFQNTVRAVTSQVDLSTWQERPNARVDHDNASVASAAVFHPNGLYAFVTLETSREVAVLDVQHGLQLFRKDVGYAPQAVQVSPDGRTLYVYNYMGRSVSVLDLAPLVDFGQRDATLAGTWATITGTTAYEAGKRLFYDARDTRLAADGYMSCAACHNDGGSDGRTWDMTHAGEGLRNTPTLRGRSGDAYGRRHWTGNFDEVQDFETQIRNLAGGKGLMSDAQYFSGTVASPLGTSKAGRSADLDALAAFVNSMTATDPSPYRQNSGAYTAAANAGYRVFTQNCASCHTVGPYTNSTTNRLFDVGTLKPASGQRLGGPLTGLDTPSLRNAWSSAPYLHDGSAATLEAAIQAHTTLGLKLSAQDMSNLTRFVKEIE